MSTRRRLEEVDLGSSRADGPKMAAQALMSGVAKSVFRLNGQFLTIGEALARPVGLTAAWWQVLGAVLDEPLPAAEIGRKIGVTRQSVQRVADLLVANGLADYRPNPAHRRAKLLLPTEQGRAAVHRISPAHAALAERLATELGTEALRRALDSLASLSAALDKFSHDQVGHINARMIGAEVAEATND